MKSLLVRILSFLSALPIIPFFLKLALVRLNYRFKHILPGEREFLFTHYHGTISVYIKPLYPIEREMATGTYDRVSCEVIAKFVKPDSLVVDVGANAGALTLYIAKLLRTGTVVAIEPGPPIFARLRRNIDLNPELRKRIVPLHMGVSDTPGTLHWAEDPNNRGNAGMLNPEGESVSVVTIDSLYHDGVIPGADFIKIDIEGMELEALRGATELIRQKRPVIYFETLEPFRAVRGFDIFGEICTLFHALHYDLWGVDDKGRFIPLEDLSVLKYPNTLAVPEEKRGLVAGEEMRLNIAGLRVDAVARNVYPVLLLGIAVLSYLFSWTKGFVYGLDREAFTDNLMSSGSNDNLMICSGAFLFSLPLLCRLFRFKRAVNLLEDMLLCVALLVQALLLLSVEAGSFYLTVAVGGNILLALWIMAYALLCLSLFLRMLSRFQKFINARS